MEETFYFTGSLPSLRTGGRPTVGSRSEVADPKVQHLTSPYGFTVNHQGRVEISGTIEFIVPREQFIVNVLQCYRYERDPGDIGLIVLEQSYHRNDNAWSLSFNAEWESPGLVDEQGREIVYSLYSIHTHGYTTNPFPNQLVSPDSRITFRYGEA